MIIGISGKKQHGKDTIGKIIQGLTIGENEFVDGIKGFLDSYSDMEGGRQPKWQIKWFAEPLKDIVCILVGCTRKQLEDNDFKEKELGEEWWLYKQEANLDGMVLKLPKLITIEEYNNIITKAKHYYHLIKLTSRKLLQLIGTECGRQIIHPNIWVNALMSEYKEKFSPSGIGNFHDPINYRKSLGFPDWIVTDVRFENEVKAIRDREGVIIRVNREIHKVHNTGMHVWCDREDETGWVFSYNPDRYTKEEALLLFRKSQDSHESETALDNYKDFDFVINNDRDIEGLIDQVRVILKTLKII